MRDSDKRGFSKVVTTILLILLIIAALAIVWVAVNSFILNSSNSVTTGQFGIDLIIKSAWINYANGAATVEVYRNPGVSTDAKIVAIKFIVEDHRNSDSFRVNVDGFPELTKRTFILDLNQSKILNISDVYRISVAPVFLTSAGGGVEITGSGSNGRDVGGNNTQYVPPNSTTNVCTKNLDCGTDYWINDSNICSQDGTQVLQYKRIFTCYTGFCLNSTTAYVIQNCTVEQNCYAGQCINISQQPSCTPENVTQDCGQSGFVGFPYCNANPPPEEILRDYANYSCINESCVQSTTANVTQLCPSPQICSTVGGTAQCFEPIECTTNADCPVGEVCIEGNCTPEVPAINGTVSSSWPPGLNEYFDSPDLPNNVSTSTTDYRGYTIIFPGSTQRECLTVKDYVYPPKDTYNSYIQLSYPETNITAGDEFELWETNYGCVVLNNSL